VPRDVGLKREEVRRVRRSSLDTVKEDWRKGRTGGVRRVTLCFSGDRRIARNYVGNGNGDVFRPETPPCFSMGLSGPAGWNAYPAQQALEMTLDE